MSSPDINYPAQPSYGEGLSESLKAQADFLRGTGDFAEVGSLESLLPLEERIRKQTAQTDTDVLRQTLLGSESKVIEAPDYASYVQQNPDLLAQFNAERAAGNAQSIEQYGQLHYETYEAPSVNPDGRPMPTKFAIPGAEPVTNAQGQAESAGGGRYQLVTIPGSETLGDSGTIVQGKGPSYVIIDTQTGATAKEFDSWQSSNVAGRVTTGVSSDDAERMSNEALQSAIGELSSMQSTIDESGGDVNAVSFQFTNPNTGEPLREGETVRTTGGMVDLLGDTRQLIGEERTAGFDDMGNFLGLSALTEDIGASQQSRQRERDLADVERLSGRYKDVMDKFREEDIMTSVGEVGGPQDVFLNDMRNLRAGTGGEAGPVGATGPAGTAGQVAPVGVTSTPAPSVSPSAPVDPMLAQIAQTGTPTGAGLRETLANEALLGLRSGLTEREERQIAEAARARSTMMGRTFDQSAAIDEAGARVAEDNQRRMQNLALAQSVLGQEGGLRMQELAMQQRNNLDPFTAILGRSGGSTVGQAGQVLGQAGYGLQSAPQYLNPEAGLGYIQTQSTNAANVAAAQAAAGGASQAGLMSGLGSLGGGIASGIGAAGGAAAFFCWVAREVYGEHNPAWLLFRNWMFTESPSWFFKLYKKYGERFARFISDKPRLKARIRMWMDKKIGGQ